MSGKGKRGFTLVELGIVIALVALVATIAARSYAGVRDRARVAVALHEMKVIREAFVGSGTAEGYLDDMAGIPGFSPAYLRMANILVATNLYAYGMERDPSPALRSWDDAAGRGWRGPYVRLDRPGPDGDTLFPAATSRRTPRDDTFAESGFFPDLTHLALPADYIRDSAAYGFAGEPALFDPWGAPYILQIPPRQAFAKPGGVLDDDVSDEERFHYARIVSAGPDGKLSTPCYWSNTNSAASKWNNEERRASIFAGTAAQRGDDLVLFLTTTVSPCGSQW